jgi:hypothetical protein
VRSRLRGGLAFRCQAERSTVTAAVTSGSASTTSSTAAASRANLIVVWTVRQRVEPMCPVDF